MIRRRVAVAAVVVGAVALCCGAIGAGAVADPTGYDARTRAATVQACTRSGGDEAACACAYDALAGALPFAAFAEVDDEVTTGGELDPELVALLGPCSRLPA